MVIICERWTIWMSLWLWCLKTRFRYYFTDHLLLTGFKNVFVYWFCLECWFDRYQLIEPLLILMGVKAIPFDIILLTFHAHDDFTLVRHVNRSDESNKKKKKQNAINGNQIYGLELCTIWTLQLKFDLFVPKSEIISFLMNDFFFFFFLSYFLRFVFIWLVLARKNKMKHETEFSHFHCKCHPHRSE